MSHGLGEAIMGLIAIAIALFIAFEAGYKAGWADCFIEFRGRLLGLVDGSVRSRRTLKRTVDQALAERSRLDRERLP